MSLDNILLIPGVGGGAKGLLDLYPGAAAGVSWRKLRNDYSGPCIRIRRSSDSAEQDIGFVNNYIDTASILSFAGAGDAFTVRWYDQVGSYDFSIAIAASQPFIVKAGVLQGGVRVEISSSRYMDSSLSTLQSLPVSIFDVSDVIARNVNIFNDVGFVYGGSSGGFQGRYEFLNSSINYQVQRRNTSGVSGLSLGSPTLQKNALAAIYGTTAINAKFNGVDFGPQSYTSTEFATSSVFRFGSTSALGVDLTMEKQEWIIYLSDQTANAAAIHANQRSYWGTV